MVVIAGLLQEAVTCRISLQVRDTGPVRLIKGGKALIAREDGCSIVRRRHVVVGAQLGEDGLFFEVSPSDGIEEAMHALFLQVVSLPKLTMRS